MSLTRTVSVFCDGGDCLDWYGEGPNAATARAEARREGYTRRDGRDLCRRCTNIERGHSLCSDCDGAGHFGYGVPCSTCSGTGIQR